MAVAGAEEVMLAAGSLERRGLPLGALRRIMVFSLADHTLVQQHFDWGTIKKEPVVALDLKDGQLRS
jgi:hypothetical protein